MTKQLRITVDGKTYDVLVETLDGTSAPVAPVMAAPVVAPVAVASPVAVVAPAVAPVAPAVSGGTTVPSPLSGTIVDIHVTEGQAVKEGDLLITLEAMKMNTPINAPASGTVRGIQAQKGVQVEEGQTLLTIS